MKALKTLFLIVALACTMPLHAQKDELLVDTMYMDDTDLEAQANIVKDNNGQPYALLKIAIPIEGAVGEKTATVGNIIQKTGELWAYVTADPDYGATEMVIQHPSYYPLTIRFSDWNFDELKGKCVYRIKIGVPSALLTMANSNLNNLRFKEAEDAYRVIVNDETVSASDKIFAEKRLASLPQWMQINENATLYAKRYIKMAKAGEANKKILINTLDSAVYWYSRLYKISGIYQARNISSRFSEILGDMQGTTVLEGTIDLLQQQSTGVWIKKKRRALKGVTVEIQNKLLGDEISTQAIDTDGLGHFCLEIKNGHHVGLVFRYVSDGVVYRSQRIDLSDDKYLNVSLKSR